MTDEERDNMKALAEQWAHNAIIGPFTSALVALSKAYLSVLADQAARGEVVQACPECKSLTGLAEPATPAHKWQCLDCGAVFSTPDRYQRIPQPAKEPV